MKPIWPVTLGRGAMRLLVATAVVMVLAGCGAVWTPRGMRVRWC